MQNDIVLKKLNFDLLTPRVGGGLWAKYLLIVATFCDPFGSICNMSMF